MDARADALLAIVTAAWRGPIDLLLNSGDRRRRDTPNLGSTSIRFRPRVNNTGSTDPESSSIALARLTMRLDLLRPHGKQIAAAQVRAIIPSRRGPTGYLLLPLSVHRALVDEGGGDYGRLLAHITVGHQSRLRNEYLVKEINFEPKSRNGILPKFRNGS
jgi:hypothetical protein